MQNNLAISLAFALLLKSQVLSLGESVQVLVTYLVNGILPFVAYKLLEGRARSDGLTSAWATFLCLPRFGASTGVTDVCQPQKDKNFNSGVSSRVHILGSWWDKTWSLSSQGLYFIRI